MRRAPSTEVRNFAVNLIEGGLFIASTPFLSAQAVLPALVAGLGGGNLAIGAVAVIAGAGLYLPQLLAAARAAALPRKRRAVLRVGLVHRLAVVAMALAVLLAPWLSSGVALAAVLALLAANALLMGVNSPAWFDLYAKLTPVRWRGRLAGLRNALGGGIALASGGALAWMLARPFPIGFALALGAGAALQMLSLAVQSRLVEDRESVVRPRQPLAVFLARVPSLLRGDPDFARFLGVAALASLALAPAGFFAVYAMARFAAPPEVIGRLAVLMVAAQAVSAPLVGALADRWGNRAALVVAAGAMLGASATALAAPSLGAFAAVYVLLGVNLGSELMMRYNIAAEYAPEGERPIYLGIMNTALAPFCLSGLAAGALADAFGYRAVFAVGVALSLATVALLLAGVRDPRSRRRRLAGQLASAPQNG